MRPHHLVRQVGRQPVRRAARQTLDYFRDWIDRYRGPHKAPLEKHNARLDRALCGNCGKLRKTAYGALANTRVPLVPPKPNEFLTA